jgi:hypothetical protein
MALGTLVSLEQYLNTSYDPDVEYVDGVLEERHVGDWLHSLIQSNLILSLRRKYPQIYVVAELRSQTRATRCRLPDVCVLLAPPQAKYLPDAAFVAIEILSEDDRMTKMMEKTGRVLAKRRSQHLGHRSASADGLHLFLWRIASSAGRRHRNLRRPAPGTQPRGNLSAVRPPGGLPLRHVEHKLESVIHMKLLMAVEQS